MKIQLSVRSIMESNESRIVNSSTLTQVIPSVERPGTFLYLAPGTRYLSTFTSHFLTLHCVSPPQESIGPQDFQCRLPPGKTQRRSLASLRGSRRRCTTRQSSQAATTGMLQNKTQQSLPRCYCNCLVAAGCRSQRQKAGPG